MNISEYYTIKWVNIEDGSVSYSAAPYPLGKYTALMMLKGNFAGKKKEGELISWAEYLVERKLTPAKQLSDLYESFKLLHLHKKDGKSFPQFLEEKFAAIDTPTLEMGAVYCGFTSGEEFEKAVGDFITKIILS